MVLMFIFLAYNDTGHFSKSLGHLYVFIFVCVKFILWFYVLLWFICLFILYPSSYSLTNVERLFKKKKNLKSSIDSFERQNETQRERGKKKKKRNFLHAGSLPSYPRLLSWDTTARSQELHLVLSGRWQELKHLNHHLWLPGTLGASWVMHEQSS